MSVVLTYHAIGECSDDRQGLFVSPDAFAAQMAFVARVARVVDLATLVVGKVPRSPRPAVAITFDDGYRNVLEHAAPVLARHGFTGTFFVPTAYLGRRNGWDPPSTCSLDVLATDELLAAERAGLRIESHGASHLDLGAASEAEVEHDVRESVEAIEAALGRRPRLFAYPFGQTSPVAERVVERLGFDAAFTIEQPHRGRYAWGRVGVAASDGRGLFALKVSGAYLAVRRSRLGEAAYAHARPLQRRTRLSRPAGRSSR